MTTVSETIPHHLAHQTQAALAWWNAEQDVAFEVTGIIDPAPEAAPAGESRELRLVLCGGDRCEQRSFRVQGGPEAWSVSLVNDQAPVPGGEAKPIPELDPPPGARRGWLARALEEHAFVLLIFYRGFW